VYLFFFFFFISLLTFLKISKYEVELPTDDDAGTQFVNVNEAQLILEGRQISRKNVLRVI